MDSAYEVIWNDPKQTSEAFGVKNDVALVADEHAEVLDFTSGLRVVVLPAAAEEMHTFGFHIEGTQLIFKKTEPMDLAGPQQENKHIVIRANGSKTTLEFFVEENTGDFHQYVLFSDTETLRERQ